jgi:hypothetical protein
MNNLREINQPSPQSPQVPARNKFFVFFITNKAVFITLGVILFLFLSLIFSRVLGQKESAFKQNITPTIEIVPTEAPIPTKSSNSERGADDLNDANNKRPAALAPRFKDNNPVSNLSITPTPTVTPTPTPGSDSTGPTLSNISGPNDESTITTNDFCFVITYTDDVTSSSNISVQYRFPSSSSDWSSWSTWDNSSSKNICFWDVADGSYSFWVRGKDSSGNTSYIYKTSFTVDVP